jgi:hypothetical protein
MSELPAWRELMGFVSLSEAAALRGQDVKTVEQQLREHITYLSPRRRAVRLFVALSLPPPILPPLDQNKAPKPIEPERKLRGIAAQRIGRPGKAGGTIHRPKTKAELEPIGA